MILTGCGAVTTNSSHARQVTDAATVTLLPTPVMTATFEPPTSGPFTCPTAINGSQHVFLDAQTGLRFTYPAAWTENTCLRTVNATGTEILTIGNLFDVYIAPRTGQSIQQWVDAQTDQKNEVITLSPLAAPNADAAVIVSVQRASSADPTLEWDREPFTQASAIVAGSQRFYVVNRLTAQVSMDDTMPTLTREQFVQQVVTTFAVP